MSDEDHMHGFSTDDDDSSDEEVTSEGGVDIAKLPTVAKDDATVQKKLERAQRQPVRPSPTSTRVHSSDDRNTTRASSRSVVYPMAFTRTSSVPTFRNLARFYVCVYPGIKRWAFRGRLLRTRLSCFLDRKIKALRIPRI